MKGIIFKRIVFDCLLVLAFLSLPSLHVFSEESNLKGTKVLQSEKKIAGEIVDTDGLPVIGASVLVVGTSIGTVSDMDGKFSLPVPDNAVLKVSYVGYITQEVTVGNNTTINVKLLEDSRALDEVVVIGYGTMKKVDVTSAVASVRPDDFNKGAVRNATQLIQGKVAGLSIITPSGDPTQGTEIILRGTATLKSGASPLILIDGIPGDLNSVAPEDIDGIDVLKDGSAAAIYGTRGTNGVILITTKQVRGDVAPTFSYSGKVSTQQITKKPEFMSADEFRANMSKTDGYKDWGGNTDWLDLVTQTPYSQEHNASLKAGMKNANVIANINFNKNDGLFLRTGINNFKGRIDANFFMLDQRLKFNVGLLNNQRSYWPGFSDNIYRNALMRNPTDLPYDESGNYIDRPEVYMYFNPLIAINEKDGETKNDYTRMNGNITFELFKDFNAKLLLSRDKFNSLNGMYETKKYFSTIREKRNGVASRSELQMVSDLLEFTLNYKGTFGKHNVTALAGYSYQDYLNESMSMGNYGFQTDAYSYNKMDAGSALKTGYASMSSEKKSSKLIGFFTRANYSFDERYLLSGSLRYEGSSKFGPNYKWGMFPSISGGWRIAEEAFMEDVTFISNLKLRVGYGVTGIDVDNPYQSLSGLNYSTANQFQSNGVWVPELVPSRNPNSELRWERKHEMNFGLDYAFMDDRIFGSIDYYIRNTKDALWDYDVSVPPYIFGQMMANVGELRNEGLEVALGFRPLKTAEYSWTSTVNFSTNTNKLISLSNDQFKTASSYVDLGDTGEPIQAKTHRMEVGGPVGNFYGWKSVDIDDKGIWIIEKPNGERVSYLQAAPEDKQILGNGLPKYYLSWNNTFTYKGFDLELNMRGAFDFQVLNYQRMYYENPKLAQYNRLKTAMDPVYGKTQLKNDLVYVSYYVEDGDYFKIDNASLGYTFKLKKTNVLKDFRLFVSCMNLATFTKYKGVDPEVNSTGLTPGNDYRDKYPTTRTFTFGLNFTL